MASDFQLHPQLKQQCFHIVDFDVNLVLLMNDSRFPWYVLVPKVADLRDFHELPSSSHANVFSEIERVSTFLLNLPSITKINVAALGNQVPQLHIHVIGRSEHDVAWPLPVWSVGQPVPYAETAFARLIEEARQALV